MSMGIFRLNIEHVFLISFAFIVENIKITIQTNSIVIDRYSHFGNTYLSKEFARVLGPGQIVTSLEHLT
jgi:hypothetical protein